MLGQTLPLLYIGVIEVHILLILSCLHNIVSVYLFLLTYVNAIFIRSVPRLRGYSRSWWQTVTVRSSQR